MSATRIFSSYLEAFTEVSNSRPDDIALLTPGKKDTTFDELFDRNEKIRRQLAQFGVSPETRTGIVVPTRDAMATAHLAVVTSATSAPLSAITTPSELEFAIKDFGLDAVRSRRARAQWLRVHSVPSVLIDEAATSP